MDSEQAAISEGRDRAKKRNRVLAVICVGVSVFYLARGRYLSGIGVLAISGCFPLDNVLLARSVSGQRRTVLRVVFVLLVIGAVAIANLLMGAKSI